MSNVPHYGGIATPGEVYSQTIQGLLVALAGLTDFDSRPLEIASLRSQ
jgi:hypothetical protein